MANSSQKKPRPKKTPFPTKVLDVEDDLENTPICSTPMKKRIKGVHFPRAVRLNFDLPEDAENDDPITCINEKVNK